MLHHHLQLLEGQQIAFSPTGMLIEGELTLEAWTKILHALHSVKTAYHCSLADLMSYGRKRFGNDAVDQAIEDAQMELADVTRADAIGQLTFEFREKHSLSAEHYFVLSKVDGPERKKWASIAIKEDLSALELKRSIEAGKVMHLSDIQENSGLNSGVNTIQGAIFRMEQWKRTMGGNEKILSLPKQERLNLLELLTPTVELAAQLEESLN